MTDRQSRENRYCKKEWHTAWHLSNSKKDWRQGFYFRTKIVQLIFSSAKLLDTTAERCDKRRKNPKVFFRRHLPVQRVKKEEAQEHPALRARWGSLLLAHSLLAPCSALSHSSPRWLPRLRRTALSPQVMPTCWHVPLPELELLGASPRDKSLQVWPVQLHRSCKWCHVLRKKPQWCNKTREWKFK